MKRTGIWPRGSHRSMGTAYYYNGSMEFKKIPRSLVDSGYGPESEVGCPA